MANPAGMSAQNPWFRAAIHAPESCNTVSCDRENTSPIRVYGDALEDTLRGPEGRRHVSTGQHNRGSSPVRAPDANRAVAARGHGCGTVRRERAARNPKLMAPQYGA